MRSDAIKHWIKNQGLTQEDVARTIGYTRTSVTRALAKDEAAGEFWKHFSAAYPQAAAEMLLSAASGEKSRR